MLDTKQNAKPKFFFVHNFGGLANNPYASTQDLSEKHIESAHKGRRFPKSDLGYHIGYNAIIYPDYWEQYRKIGEETAAVKGWNQGHIHVAMAGNFNEYPKGSPIDKPTDYQVKILKQMEEWAYKELDISALNYGPHRMKGQTDCYGTSLSDEWSRSLLLEHLDKMAGIADVYRWIIVNFINAGNSLVRSGGVEHECPGYLNLNEDLKVVKPN